MSITVVGSGASAVHFARSAIENGEDVVLVDVGRERPDPVRPEDSFEELKRNLDDPVAHLLGEAFEAVTYPGDADEYYGFPPNKSYIFEGLDGFEVRSTGFAPLFSFARGGLAEAWTAGVFPFNEGELADFPLGLEELGPYYDLVAERIGITGQEDDLARQLPVHDHLGAPLRLDEHSRLLLERIARKRDRLRRLGFTFGRSRIATLSEDSGDRPGCRYLGRCLLGCPIDSLYTPALTLSECESSPRFTYRPGLCVRRFRVKGSRVTGLVAERVDGSGVEELDVDRLVLAAGTLSSSKIFLESWREAKGEDPRLVGLMDNRQILMPFLNPAMIRRRHDPETYQYHQITIGLEAPDPRDYVHGLLTTLKTASIHPIVQSVPFDLRTALWVFRNVHAALGLVNVNFPDRRRDGSYVTLEGEESPALRVHYESPAGERARLRSTMARFRRALLALGCLVPPGLSHVRPMGASVHYAGTVPMREREAPLTTSADGRSHDFENLWFADATTFPFLPAKNLTFTLMANAARIADRMTG